MTQEAKVRVRIDTQQAKADMASLGRSGKEAAGRVGDRLNKPSAAAGRGGGIKGRPGGGGRIGGGLGLGVGLGMGIGIASSVGKAALSPIGEVVAEGRVGFDAIAADAVGAPEARGKRRAREEARSIFGRSGDPEGAVGYYESTKDWRIQQEKAMNQIDQRIGGKELVEDAKALSSSVVGAITTGFDRLIELIGTIGR